MERVVAGSSPASSPFGAVAQLVERIAHIRYRYLPLGVEDFGYHSTIRLRVQIPSAPPAGRLSWVILIRYPPGRFSCPLTLERCGPDGQRYPVEIKPLSCNSPTNFKKMWAGGYWLSVADGRVRQALKTAKVV